MTVTSLARRGRFMLVFLIAFLGAPVFASPAFVSSGSVSSGRPEAIASAHPLATAAGFEMLNQGGNAFDAAVAVAATLAVVEPYGSGLGGGGFFLLRRVADGREVMVDARERAPLAARADLFLDARGEPILKASLEGGKAAAIPGLPAGLDLVARRYGRLPLAASLAPAIRYAEHGFAADARFVKMVRQVYPLLRANPAAAPFLDRGQIPAEGFRVVQPRLAQTLRALAGQGPAGFYTGAVAGHLLEAVRGAGGVWQEADLRDYRALERAPLKFSFGALTVTTASLPSSGGVTLAQILNILEPLPWARMDGLARVQVTVEAMRRAYQDRARYLGDPDFSDPPLAMLTSRTYAAERRASIRLGRASPLDAPRPVAVPAGADTTHFSVADREGNLVAATLSINTPFGAGVIAAGVVLNNEMDDFAAAPGVANAYGLVGGEANAVAPGKRPLSSMSPTFIDDGRGVLVLGTPGGSRIISMVLLGILDYASHAEVNLARTVGRSRYHHQFLPDRVEIEPGPDATALAAGLRGMGYDVKIADEPWGNMQAVWLGRTGGGAQAASDPRGVGSALVWW